MPKYCSVCPFITCRFISFLVSWLLGFILVLLAGPVLCGSSWVWSGRLESVLGRASDLSWHCTSHWSSRTPGPAASFLLLEHFAGSIRNVKTSYIFLHAAASFSTEMLQTHQLSINCFKMKPSSKAKEVELKKWFWEREGWEPLLVLRWNIYGLRSFQSQQTSFPLAIRMPVCLSSVIFFYPDGKNKIAEPKLVVIRRFPVRKAKPILSTCSFNLLLPGCSCLSQERSREGWPRRSMLSFAVVGCSLRY